MRAWGHGISVNPEPANQRPEVLGLAGHTGENDLLVLGEHLEALRFKDVLYRYLNRTGYVAFSELCRIGPYIDYHKIGLLD
jgi:hypothetical protein